MEVRKTLKLTNQNQFLVLVKLMESNEQLARGFSKGINKTDIKREWNSIAEQLNSKGPPIRDGDGWQKVWADFKFKVKKKIINNSKEIKATGGGPNQLQILSPLEDAVSNLLKYKQWLNPNGNPIGVSQSNSLPNTLTTTSGHTSTRTQATDADASLSNLEAEVLNIEDGSVELEGEVLEQQQPEQQHETEEPARKKRRHASASTQERTKLLEKLSVLQEKTLNGINESLKKIEGYAKEIERNVRKSYKLKEDTDRRDAKRLKIQEEKFIIYKQEMERKDAQRKETNKIKMMELEIKKKHIEIQEKKLRLNSLKETAMKKNTRVQKSSAL